MRIKILQLNMWAGTHFPAIKKFLQENDFDILCFEEVDGQGTYVGNVACEINCFENLQEALGKNYVGQLTKASFFTSSPKAYDGNAIFYRKGFTFKRSDIFWLNKRNSPFPSDAKSYENVGRNALCLELEKGKETITIITAHFAWGQGKAEHLHQAQQNQKFLTYVASLKKPWVITGDLNLAPNQPSIVALEAYGRNLIKEYHVKNTIDPTLHVRWDEFDPGEAIDYIFVSSNVKVNSFTILDKVHMSDHFGLTAEIEI